MLPRTLEPEVMDSAEEARDYDAMDHSEVNTRFCEDLLAADPRLADPGGARTILDVGTGTALIPIELLRRAPSARAVAIDLSTHMLALAERNVAKAGLSARVEIARRDAKRTGWADGAFDAVVSNSIVHHIPEPGAVLGEMWRLVARGGSMFVRDLSRPASDAEVDALVQRYGGTAPDDPEAHARFVRQRGLFRDSLRAALTVDEVRSAVAAWGIPPGAVSLTSDRHWTLAHSKP